jgi:hypothetical protein
MIHVSIPDLPHRQFRNIEFYFCSFFNLTAVQAAHGALTQARHATRNHGW